MILGVTVSGVWYWCSDQVTTQLRSVLPACLTNIQTSFFRFVASKRNFLKLLKALP